VIVSGSAAAVLILLALITLVAGFSGTAPLRVPGFPDFVKPPNNAGAQTPNPGEPTGAAGGAVPSAGGTQNPTAGSTASVDPTSRRHIPTQTPSHPPKPTKT
jgi:hypothetical protein